MVDQSLNHSVVTVVTKSSFIRGVHFTALLKTGKNLPRILTFFDFPVSFINALGFLEVKILLGFNSCPWKGGTLLLHLAIKDHVFRDTEGHFPTVIYEYVP